MAGLNSYNNGVGLLDEICVSCFNNGESYVKQLRSLKAEDVQALIPSAPNIMTAGGDFVDDHGNYVPAISGVFDRVY